MSFKFHKFKPIRKEEVIIKTALPVCHDKWRGVGWANDSGSVFAVLSCFFFLSTQKEDNTRIPEYQLNIQLEKLELHDNHMLNIFEHELPLIERELNHEFYLMPK